MFEFYGGVPAVIVPDCLKNGVVKVHRYDPDLNPDYVELASHYSTAVVPARPRHTRDKALGGLKPLRMR
jgi:transposase